MVAAFVVAKLQHTGRPSRPSDGVPSISLKLSSGSTSGRTSSTPRPSSSKSSLSVSSCITRAVAGRARAGHRLPRLIHPLARRRPRTVSAPRSPTLSAAQPPPCGSWSGNCRMFELIFTRARKPIATGSRLRDRACRNDCPPVHDLISDRAGLRALLRWPADAIGFGGSTHIGVLFSPRRLPGLSRSEASCDSDRRVKAGGSDVVNRAKRTARLESPMAAIAADMPDTRCTRHGVRAAA